MKADFKAETTKNKSNEKWEEAYVSFDEKKTWYAIGGGESPLDATKIIKWYREK